MTYSNFISFCFFLFASSIGYGQVVSTEAQLEGAINSASPGTTIMLADGTWKDVLIDIDKNGTSALPITITAQNPGSVLMTGNSRVVMEGAYLTISGLIFQDPSNLDVNGSRIRPVIELDDCDYCKIINNKIDAYNGTESQKSLTYKWILADGVYNEIAYNSFIGKYGIGSIINDNRNESSPDYLSIHHNYFADRTPINELNEDNDQDAIRIGNSGTSLDDSFTEVYDNYFFNFFGEIEIISNKSGSNKYYNNTFRDYAGTLTLRHGDDCEVYGNYFFAEHNTFSGGVRVIGEGHKIYNNYIEGINSKKDDGSTSNATGGINVSNGRPNSALSGYFQVRNTEVVNNTFVNCDFALRVGTNVAGDLSLAPENLAVANNIMYNSSNNDYQILTSPIGSSVSEGNIEALSGMDMEDDGNFHRLTNENIAVDGGLDNYDYVNIDILGGVRDADIDAGAEEFGAEGTRLPYNGVDVGVNIGFGALSTPSLSLSVPVIDFGLYGGSITFEVLSNVDWMIEDNTSWLSFDKNFGSGRQAVTLTVDQNNSGEEREVTIDILEVAGGSGLSAELTIAQSIVFVPVEIPIVGSTTVGMQDKDGIEKENAYDDDFGTYWTGDPDVEPEVSITFDLSCLHELTDIGINFWKADERVTIFSLAVSDDASGPFTTVLETGNSEDSGVSVTSEQFFDLEGVIARYVKFVGIGNSSETNWTSVANVNIYGDLNCDGVSSTEQESVSSSYLSVYPNPVSAGILTLSSEKASLGSIKIYDITGRLVIADKEDNQHQKQIDISQLSSGIYFVKTDGGQTRFVME